MNKLQAAVTLVSSKRAQNIAIGLTKVTALPYAEIAGAIASLNAHGVLGWEDATALQPLLPTHDEAAAALAVRARLRDGAEAALSTDADRFALCLAGVERADAKLEAVVFMVRAALKRTRARTHTRAHIDGWRCCCRGCNP